MTDMSISNIRPIIGAPLPAVEPLPPLQDFASPIHHMVADVLRAGRASVVREDAHAGADRQRGRFASRTVRDDSVLLVRIDDDQVVDRAAIDVADDTVTLVERLFRGASIAR